MKKLSWLSQATAGDRCSNDRMNKEPRFSASDRLRMCRSDEWSQRLEKRMRIGSRVFEFHRGFCGTGTIGRILRRHRSAEITGILTGGDRRGQADRVARGLDQSDRR